MRFRYAVLASALLASAASGQTLVDLRTQTKSVDFTGATTTKPFKSGTVLPATCTVGEAFFQTNAPAGQNVYACTALNAWTLEAGGPGATGPTGPKGATGATGPAGSNGAIAHIQNAGTSLPVEGNLNFTSGGCTDDPSNGRTNCNGAGIAGLGIAVNGSTQGTQPTLNLVSGNGIIEACSNNAGANRVDCTPSLNSAVALTIATSQAGKHDFCNSTTGTDAYTCSLNASAALTAYTAGMHLTLTGDAGSSGPATLNVDSLGTKSIKQSDGASDPSNGQIVAGRPIVLYFDGTVWRLPAYSGVGACDDLHTLSGAGNCLAASSIWGSVALTSQSASVGSTTLVAAPVQGMYRVITVATTTTVATSGSGCSLIVTIGYTDGAGATTSNTVSGLSLTALGRQSGAVNAVVTGGTITYSTTRTAGSCSGDRYAVNIIAQRLQ